jgi:shikimate kinase
MGSGKTTIGKRLASHLNYKFIDMDDFIVAKLGMSINDIFKQKGEDFFRKTEHQTLVELSKQKNLVISTGGGVPCFFDNMKLMNQNGITIYLRLSSQALGNRLFSLPEATRSKRPLLANKTEAQLQDYIQKTLNQREPYYAQAKFIVHADNQATNETFNCVTDYLVSLKR